jgi:hypothetical protein
MPTYSKIAFSDIRSYMWEELKNSGVVSINDYWSEPLNAYLNPIIPAQQVPEFQNILPGVPYIVYDIETDSYDDEFWICQETANLYVVSINYEKIYEILEFLKDIFRRFDQSAHDVNNFINPSIFRFLKIYVDGLLSPEYGDEEGGIQAGTIKISYQYVREIDNFGRYSK